MKRVFKKMLFVFSCLFFSSTLSFLKFAEASSSWTVLNAKDQLEIQDFEEFDQELYAFVPKKGFFKLKKEGSGWISFNKGLEQFDLEKIYLKNFSLHQGTLYAGIVYFDGNDNKFEVVQMKSGTSEWKKLEISKTIQASKQVSAECKSVLGVDRIFAFRKSLYLYGAEAGCDYQIDLSAEPELEFSGFVTGPHPVHEGKDVYGVPELSGLEKGMVYILASRNKWIPLGKWEDINDSPEELIQVGNQLYALGSHLLLKLEQQIWKKVQSFEVGQAGQLNAYQNSLFFLVGQNSSGSPLPNTEIVRLSSNQKLERLKDVSFEKPITKMLIRRHFLYVTTTDRELFRLDLNQLTKASFVPLLPQNEKTSS